MCRVLVLCPSLFSPLTHTGTGQERPQGWERDLPAHWGTELTSSALYINSTASVLKLSFWFIFPLLQHFPCLYDPVLCIR